jgi:hypothetical protein
LGLLIGRIAVMKFSMFIQPPRPNPRKMTGSPSAVTSWLPRVLRQGLIDIISSSNELGAWRSTAVPAQPAMMPPCDDDP